MAQQEAKLEQKPEAREPAQTTLDQERNAQGKGGKGRGRPRAKDIVVALNKRTMSTTDPDARLVRQGQTKARPRYKNHRAIDNAHGVITATLTTGGDVEENSQLLELAEQHETNTGSGSEHHGSRQRLWNDQQLPSITGAWSAHPYGRHVCQAEDGQTKRRHL